MASTFPSFSDGDVEIQLSKGDKHILKLHSCVLALHSSWFKASLSDRWNSSGTDMAPSPDGPRKYQLRFEQGAIGLHAGMLTRITPNSDLKGTFLANADGSPSTGDIEDGYSEEDFVDAGHLDFHRLECITAHRDMLGAFYHVVPDYQKSCVHELKVEVRNLVEVADIYDCGKVIALPVDNLLRQSWDELLEECETNQIGNIEFAMEVHCAWLFKEAAMMLIGRSDPHYATVEERLMDLDLDIMFDEQRERFRRELCDTEHKLFTLEPFKHSPNSENQLAVQFLRWYISKYLQQGQGSKFGPGYAKLYHSIYAAKTKGVEQAIPKDVTEYLELMSSTVDRGDFIKLLQTVFNEAASTVRDIRHNATQRKSIKFDGFRSLRFMTIEDEDVPWDME